MNYKTLGLLASLLVVTVSLAFFASAVEQNPATDIPTSLGSEEPSDPTNSNCANDEQGCPQGSNELSDPSNPNCSNEEQGCPQGSNEPTDPTENNCINDPAGNGCPQGSTEPSDPSSNNNCANDVAGNDCAPGQASDILVTDVCVNGASDTGANCPPAANTGGENNNPPQNTPTTSNSGSGGSNSGTSSSEEGNGRRRSSNTLTPLATTPQTNTPATQTLASSNAEGRGITGAVIGALGERGALGIGIFAAVLGITALVIYNRKRLHVVKN